MKIISLLLIAGLALPASGTLSPAQADDSGRVAAGVAGGFLGGLLLGNALAPRRHPPPPPEAYYGPGPADYEPPHCYWALGEPVWDDYDGIWRRHRVRICE